MPQDPPIKPDDQCPVPRGEARRMAIALRLAAQRRQLDLPAITAALMLAAQVHRHQRRSADGAPYLTHPLQVATLVCRWGGSSDEVITGLLHDTAEDSPRGPRATLNHIADMFSPAVSRRVAALTKNTALQDRRARAQDLMDRLHQAMQAHGQGTAAVRLADRLHNAVTASHLPPADLLRLQASTEDFIAPLARSLGLHGVADFLAGGPPAWAQVQPRRFQVAMLQLQEPWLAAPRAQAQRPLLAWSA